MGAPYFMGLCFIIPIYKCVTTSSPKKTQQQRKGARPFHCGKTQFMDESFGYHLARGSGHLEETFDIGCFVLHNGGWRFNTHRAGVRKIVDFEDSSALHGGFLKWWSQMSQKKTPQIDHF